MQGKKPTKKKKKPANKKTQTNLMIIFWKEINPAKNKKQKTKPIQ